MLIEKLGKRETALVTGSHSSKYKRKVFCASGFCVAINGCCADIIIEFGRVSVE